MLRLSRGEETSQICLNPADGVAQRTGSRASRRGYRTLTLVNLMLWVLVASFLTWLPMNRATMLYLCSPLPLWANMYSFGLFLPTYGSQGSLPS